MLQDDDPLGGLADDSSMVQSPMFQLDPVTASQRVPILMAELHASRVPTNADASFANVLLQLGIASADIVNSLVTRYVTEEQVQAALTKVLAGTAASSLGIDPFTS